MGIKKTFRKFKEKHFPSPYQREVQRWWADGGDYALRFDYDLLPESLVLDLGGYRGQWASDLFGRYGCNIIVFEPVKKYADLIADRFAKNPKITCHQIALGAREMEATIYVSENESSIFHGPGCGESIRIVDAASWLDKNNIDKIDLIKINIEGGEYDLMDRLIEVGRVSKMKNIQIQFHDVEKDSRDRMDSIRRELSRTHTPTYQYDFVWENWALKS